MKKFRFSLMFAFLIPLSISLGMTLYYGKSTLLYPIAFLAVINELFFLKEIDNSSSRDRGIISAVIISSTIGTLICFSHPDSPLFPTHSAGLLLVVMGCILRTWAKVTLGIHFSHTLRVLNNHKLINYGLFRFIRHPAYSGTILLMAGFGYFVHPNVALFCFLIFFILAMRRIDNEEEMMKESFGQQYLLYKKYSWKLFPFII
ncbi:methyltransferase family protein [Erwinia pyrifoliae]|uniref:methyltransferase family protein n=1 Tax=Erwinia pyrifoliae TaxID=79967 RepID=UPI0022003BDB|nr:isoprenylcysteine carboxylmethyltransferase family protein [Erwinia pyrifoliae]MCT2386075.1 isoprenylcysteine carboxylmethyltransferase family protein [Erwinia pyrifoliae]UWS29919.1 isoprenylcysteine carboxylmethyltransferase family protein [Erwinia pyrifoliae]UXK12931.1 isoprenylcysteine carboxylmethyltransferase family protein [Erwinia pyrifoliae]